LDSELLKINLNKTLVPSDLVLNNKARNSPVLQPVPIFTAVGNNKEKKPYTLEYISSNNTKITIRMIEELDSKDQTVFLAINAMFYNLLEHNKDNIDIQKLKENNIKNEDLVKCLQSVTMKTTLKNLMQHADLDYKNTAVRNRVLKSLDRLSNVIIKTENTKLIYKDLLIKYAYEKRGVLYIGMNPSNIYSNLDISNGYISHNFKERKLLPVGASQLLHYVLSQYNNLNPYTYSTFNIKDLLNKVKNLNRLASDPTFRNLSKSQKDQKLKDLRKTIINALKNFEKKLNWICKIDGNKVHIKISKNTEKMSHDLPQD